MKQKEGSPYKESPLILNNTDQSPVIYSFLLKFKHKYQTKYTSPICN